MTIFENGSTMRKMNENIPALTLFFEAYWCRFCNDAPGGCRLGVQARERKRG